jgi:hypothetical protein
MRMRQTDASMPDFQLGSGFSAGDVLDVQEITGDFLDTTMQSIGSVEVREDGSVDVVAQRVGRLLLVGKNKSVGVVIRSDGRHGGPFRVNKSDGHWAKEGEAVFERLDAPLNTEQSEAQTGPVDDLGPDADVETPPLPETQTVSKAELERAIKAKQKVTANTEGMTAPQAAAEGHDAKAQAKAAKKK